MRWRGMEGYVLRKVAREERRRMVFEEVLQAAQLAAIRIVAKPTPKRIKVAVKD